MSIICAIGRGLLSVIKILLKIVGVILTVALEAVKLFLMLFMLVLRVFFAFLGGMKV